MISALHATLVQLLRQMDEEATTQFEENGVWWPSGLRWYHHHYCPKYGGMAKCEVTWAKRLKSLLGEQGIAATQPKYPPYAVPSGKTRQHIDLQIQLPDCGYYWLEIKGS